MLTLLVNIMFEYRMSSSCTCYPSIFILNQNEYRYFVSVINSSSYVAIQAYMHQYIKDIQMFEEKKRFSDVPSTEVRGSVQKSICSNCWRVPMFKVIPLIMYLLIVWILNQKTKKKEQIYSNSVHPVNQLNVMVYEKELLIYFQKSSSNFIFHEARMMSTVMDI